jgi:WD40 repeat protein
VANNQRDLAEKATAAANEQRDRALLQESRALATLAQQASAAGDQPTAVLLALYALPDPGFGGKRPMSYEAEAALNQAWLRNRETALTGHRGTVWSASFSADGTHVVTASYDGTARVWDLRGERPGFVALEGHQGWVTSASFCADGTHVVTASRDKTARVWDLRGPRPTFVALEGHQGPVHSASFSAGGTHVVTTSEDKTARVWDLRGERPTFVALEGHQGTVYSAAFSVDGTHVVTASQDNTARVWDLHGERPSFVALEGHQGWVRSASFSPDGTHVVTASYDGTARVWRIFPDVNALVGTVRATLSRCLSQAQRDAYGLSTAQPASEDRNFIPPPTPDGRCAE